MQNAEDTAWHTASAPQSISCPSHCCSASGNRWPDLRWKQWLKKKQRKIRIDATCKEKQEKWSIES